ncbi:MAG: ECF transporter S component [Lachnospiraceae bacterium]
MNQKTKWNARKLTMTGMLAAVAFVLMFLDFSVPVMPSFIKMDFSELPALIGAFAMGPVSGAAICVVKNILHLTITTTGGVGELSNMILGLAFVIPAGLVYNYRRTMRGGILGALLGAVTMAVISVFTNYFVVYPVYTSFMPMETIIQAYQMINPNVENLWQALIWFNMPFTFIKGLSCVLITILVYKPLSPLIKGTRLKTGEATKTAH